MSTPLGYYILAGLPPASAFLVALMATYAQRTPRTPNAELIQRRRAQIERNNARKTTTQQNRTTAQ